MSDTAKTSETEPGKSALPWSIDEHVDALRCAGDMLEDCTAVESISGDAHIGFFFDKEDAIRTARAVNSHAALYEACKANIAAFEKIDAATPWTHREPDWWVEWSAQVRVMRAALSLAEGGEG